jgi:hypothetical protein
MAKRSTIARDPLAAVSDAVETPDLAAPGIVAVAATAKTAPTRLAGSANAEATAIPSAAAARSVGGRLEILGGDLGSGTATIWRYGRSERLGFVAPIGRQVDLAAELEAVLAWPDPSDHRVLGAVGWAWVVGSVAGIFGLVAGGGLRLLWPRRMLVRLRLRDGRDLVARTDQVTVAGLEALVGGR